MPRRIYRFLYIYPIGPSTGTVCARRRWGIPPYISGGGTMPGRVRCLGRCL